MTKAWLEGIIGRYVLVSLNCYDLLEVLAAGCVGRTFDSTCSKGSV